MLAVAFWVSSYHFERQFEQLLDCHLIHAPHVECGEGESCICIQDSLERFPEFLPKTVDWYKFISTTLKSSISHLIERAHHLHTPKKENQVKCEEYGRCGGRGLFFFPPTTFTELCIMNLFHKDKL